MLPTTFLAILLSTSQLGLIQDTLSGRRRIAEVYTLQRVVLTGTLKGISSWCIVYSFYSVVGTNAFGESSNHFAKLSHNYQICLMLTFTTDCPHPNLMGLLSLVRISARLNSCLSISLNSTRRTVCMASVKKALVNWKFNGRVFLVEAKSRHCRSPFPWTLIVLRDFIQLFK